ncbi:hypothetical protein C8Q76DRAFT_632165 [Earliella scabrosa]|nr:hypothetical protein C8Q76DRAFT_632165 [Earliella scabrosa]
MHHQDHFAPHKSRKFEGYYTRVQLEDGGTLAIIFCWVKRAKERGNYVLVSYMPPAADAHNAWDDGRPGALPPGAFQYEFFPPEITISPLPRDHDGHTSFTIAAPGVGHMTVTPATIEYAIVVPSKHLRVHLTLDAHTPWYPSSSPSCSSSGALHGPMGGIQHLSWALPLNWHVRSTRSRATYFVMHRASARHSGLGLRPGRGGTGDAPLRLEGVGEAHVEKNWGGSFPRGWIWAQAFSSPPSLSRESRKREGGKSEGEDEEERTLCLAGGAAFPGVQAYLIGYRSRACRWDFRPPFAMGVGPGPLLSPFLRVKRESEKGEVEICARTWRRRLRVRIAAAPESFVGMAAPLRGGHEPAYAHESFEARVEVEAARRRWPWGKWEVVERSVLGQTGDGVHCGALEFGGSYYRSVPE